MACKIGLCHLFKDSKNEVSPLFMAAESAGYLGAVASRFFILLSLAGVAFIPTFPNSLSGGLAVNMPDTLPSFAINPHA